MRVCACVVPLLLAALPCVNAARVRSRLHFLGDKGSDEAVFAPGVGVLKQAPRPLRLGIGHFGDHRLRPKGFLARAADQAVLPRLQAPAVGPQMMAPPTLPKRKQTKASSTEEGPGRGFAPLPHPPKRSQDKRAPTETSGPEQNKHKHSRQFRDELEDDMAVSEALFSLTGDDGATLPTIRAASLESEGETFALLSPVNAPIVLAERTADQLVQIDLENADAGLLEASTQACAARKIELLPTPACLTATGPGLEEVSGHFVLFKDPNAEEGNDLKEAYVLAEVEHDGRAIVIMEAVDTIYLIGKKKEGGTYIMPTEKELEADEMTILKLIDEFEGQFEDELDDEDTEVIEENAS